MADATPPCATPVVSQRPGDLASNIETVARAARIYTAAPDPEWPGRWTLSWADRPVFLGLTVPELLDLCREVERCDDCGSSRLEIREDADSGDQLVVCLDCRSVDEAVDHDVDLSEVMAVVEAIAAKAHSWPAREDRIRASLLRCGWCVGEVVTLSRAGRAALRAWREVKHHG